ncbi:hypothetical protein AN958_06797 [Leucoagaricus sp. SymC.cos]|nr:hypothetical protein AN958_06797 [Leucoagaricus sp. SymC.cos]
MIPWNAAKAKVQLRLSVQRLRTLQQKKEAQAKAFRRDIATLVERSKIETARIKVEGLINEDIHVELLELLELYCELLLARFGLLDQNTREPDPAVNEAVCSIIYAAPRTELKGTLVSYLPFPCGLLSPTELHVLRDILMHKYGREFSAGVMENRNNCVTDRARSILSLPLVVDAPSAELVDGYLREIAKGYGVSWGLDLSKPATNTNKTETAQESDKEEKLSEVKDQPSSEKGGDALPSAPSTNNVETEDDFDALAERFAALKKR